MLKQLSISITSTWLTISASFSADIYVSVNGSDANTGAKESPYQSLTKAKQEALKFLGKEAVTTYVEDGVYYLPETLTFEPKDSGTENYPVVYQAINEGKAILSGGSELKLNWEPYQNGIFKAKTPAGLKIDQLFINGKNQRMARYPNYDAEKKAEPYQGYSADAFSQERAVNWANPQGGYIHAMHLKRWGGYHYSITGKDEAGNVTYKGGWQNNRQMGMHKDYRMVENIFEELDAEMEWYHDAETNTLYYMPSEGVELQAAKVEVVRLRHLIDFNGTEAEPVKHITLQGFVVRHAARTFMETKEPLLRSDWAIYRGGAVFLTGTENISILDTEFDQVGGNAIFISKYNRKAHIKGCHIHNTGASGVCFVGDPDAVHNPLFEYNKKNKLSTINLTPGPKTNNYPAESIVEDCLIHGIGRVEKQPAGVQISMAQNIIVRDLSIYDCARSGINISEGTWGGHLIERCDVFDTVLETHDHGSFNSWGRDRFWRSDQETSQLAVNKNPDLPFLDAMKTTTIRDSRWRCDHGWDIDLDDGSSNYNIYNNLMLSNGLKLREGFRRYAWNNITVNNGLHPHVWYNGNKDKVYSNIFMNVHRPARMPTQGAETPAVDRNFYNVKKSRVMRFSDTLGWDKNSAFGDPMFIDPANGDYRVKSDSEALTIGFRNFPMDQFGVKKTSLKKIARNPAIPQLGVTRASGDNLFTDGVKWLGMTLTDLSGEEFSAYGVSKANGGVILNNVSASPKALKAGFKQGDLIQRVNGEKTPNIKAFQLITKQQNKKPLKITVIRNQQPHEIILP